MLSPLNQLSNRFIKDVNELRELLKLPEKYDKQAKKLKQDIDRFYLPMSIEVEKEKKGSLLKNQKAIDKKRLDHAITEYRKLEPQNIDSEGNLLIKIDNKYFKDLDKIRKQREKFKHSIYHKIHIERAVLFNLISYFEQLFAEILHVILKKYPEILQLNDKNLTFEDLSKFSNINDAKDFLVSQEIEKLLFGSVSGFFDFFEKKVFKATLADLLEFRSDLVEIKERRNLLIHNGGVINAKYLKIVDKKLQKKYKIKKGAKIRLEKKYLEDSIQKIELIGLEIILESSLKFQEGSARSTAIWNMSDKIYRTYENENYFLGERLSLFMLNDCIRYLSNKQIDYIQFNYWNIVKKQEGLDSVREDIIKYDVSSKNHIIQLCYYALLDSYDQACEHITPSLNDEKFTIQMYQEFPILENLRKQKKAKAIIKKYKESRKKK